MKILVMGNSGTDYLSDCLLHGLYMTDGIEIYNFPKNDLMYKDTFESGKRKLSDVYGNGFTIYGTLPKFNHYEKEQIAELITNHVFDYIVFTHNSMDYPCAGLIKKHYDPKEIVMLDGKDGTEIKGEYLKYCTYFKRENIVRKSNIHTISFAFPEEKIQTSLPKIRKDSLVKPNTSGKKNSYKYVVEQEYYDDYRQSLFGLTTKKAGWDCMRHYEIMACRCIPYWRDMNQCPKTIAQTIPKHIIRESNEWYGHSFEYYKTEQGKKEYEDLEGQIFEHFRQHCTTKALAKYVLGIMNSLK
jgi:hypothetical protein